MKKLILVSFFSAFLSCQKESLSILDLYPGSYYCHGTSVETNFSYSPYLEIRLNHFQSFQKFEKINDSVFRIISYKDSFHTAFSEEKYILTNNWFVEYQSPKVQVKGQLFIDSFNYYKISRTNNSVKESGCYCQKIK